MDSFADLPVNDMGAPTPQTEEVLDEYFPVSSGGSKAFADTSFDARAKKALYLALLYLILANPQTERFMELIPKLNSPLVRYGAKFILFFVVAYIIISS